MQDPLGSEVRVEASMTEFMSGETVTGYAKTKIIKSSIKINFLSDQPAFFKPSLPFHTFVSM